MPREVFTLVDTPALQSKAPARTQRRVQIVGPAFVGLAHFHEVRRVQGDLQSLSQRVAHTDAIQGVACLIRDPRAEVAFAEARSRINALATLHRRLYESESLQEIDLKWFLEDLCAELRRGGLSRGRSVELVVESPSEVIGPDVAVPLGLLVTEAITNAYKHAFNERDGGHIGVQVVRESPATLLLRIRDDGAGYDTAASAQDHSGLGRSLIEAFVRQLRGELEVRSEEGTVVEVRFPAALKEGEPKHSGAHHPSTAHDAERTQKAAGGVS